VMYFMSDGVCFPPSENESGVRFMIAMTCVLRLGSVAWIAGNWGEIGVVEYGVGSGGGRALR
jgi:hypothetical protein